MIPDVLPMKRTLLPAVVLGFAGLLVADLEPSAATSRPQAAVAPALVTVAKPQTVEVAFHKAGRIVRVERQFPRGVAPSLHAVKSLLRGPTKEERAKGIRSAIGEGVRLRSLRKDSDLWRVSFSRSLFGPGTAQTMQMRLAQVTTTLQRLGGPQEYVAISAEAARDGAPARARPGTWRGRRGEKGYVYSVRGVQLRMYQLGYLARGSVTGRLDYPTSQALLAFQGWEDLARTGTVTGETQVELVRAERPRPSARRSGRYVEIHRDRGVLLTVEDGVVQRAMHTSTGAGGGTPSGSFRVYRKETYSWSVPFSVWMPWASYFVGGIAMHEYPDVPGYPASHGCVRLPAGEAQRVYRFAEYGTAGLRVTSRCPPASGRPRRVGRAACFSRHTSDTKSAHGRTYVRPTLEAWADSLLSPSLASSRRSRRSSRRARRRPTSTTRGVHAQACPASAANRVDPINVVFTGWGTWGRAESQIESHVGWTATSGTDAVFVDHGLCSAMHAQRASGQGSRFHVRVRGQHWDPTLGWTATGDAHHEDFVILPDPVRPCGRLERPRRERLRPGAGRARAEFAEAGHATCGSGGGTRRASSNATATTRRPTAGRSSSSCTR